MISRKILTTLKYASKQCSRNLGHGKVIILEKSAGVHNRKSFAYQCEVLYNSMALWHY